MYDIFDRLVRAWQAAVKEFKKPIGYVKGEDFENYVRDWLFVKEQYRQLHRTQPYIDNESDFSEESTQPDFKFRLKTTGEDLYVEAKWRSKFNQDAIEWCTYHQLKRYKVFDKKIPVYVLIGIGGEPFEPEMLYCIPLKDIKSIKLTRSFLFFYQIEKKSPIDPNNLMFE